MNLRNLLKSRGFPPEAGARVHDRHLVGRMLAGDEQAFEEFFNNYFPRLYRFALIKLNQDPDEAEEVVQETLCKAVSKLKTYRGEARLFSWLCTFCRHEIFSFYEGKKGPSRQVGFIEDTPGTWTAFHSPGGLVGESPEKALDRRETARMVHVTLDRIPSRYGYALKWKYFEGLSVKEVATRLGFSSKAAESLLTRARRAFRHAFSSTDMRPEVGEKVLPTPRRERSTHS